MKQPTFHPYDSDEPSLPVRESIQDVDWIFDNAENLNAITDFDGKIIRANKAWEKLLGYSPDDILGRSFIDLVHPDEKEDAWKTFSWLLKGNNISSYESRFVSKDGKSRWLLWNSSIDLQKKVLYGTGVDITDRKTVEEELRHNNINLEGLMNKLKEQNLRLDEFAHIISHNLRSPVGNIQALLSFINENSSLEDYKVIYGKLSNVSVKLNETMNELLDILKVKTAVSKDNVKVRFKDTLDKVVQLLEGNLMQSGATVTYDFKLAPAILYSKTYLESIFQNLLSNAIKYKAENRRPEIHFESYKDGSKTILKVQDNGLGIDMERFGDKLFGMHKTFHDHEEARGVGLFLTKTQIETMGGKIYANSEVDRGTTFFIEFGN